MCSIPIGCLIPQFSTNFKPIFQCAFKPAYEIGELNCRRFCHSHVSRSWLISPDGCKWRTCTQKETQCLNAPQSGALLKWNKCPGGQGYFPRVENLAIIRFALARKIRPLKNQSKFWSRLTLTLTSKQTFDTLKKFKELFRGNSVKISNFWDRGGGQLISFSGCRALRQI